MPTDKGKEPPQAGPTCPVAEAGCILMRLADRELSASNSNPAKLVVRIDHELKRVRHLLSQAKPNSDADRHRFLAAKTALETLEARERSEPLLPYHDQFYGHVEAVRGGEGAELFGGVRISNKRNATTTFLRAALFVLWEHYKGDVTARSALVREAVLLGITGNSSDSQAKNEAAVRTRVNNIQKRPPDGQGPVAPEWGDVKFVKRLVNIEGFRKLADFQ